MDAMPDHICTICEKPVVMGQARYGVTDNHYDCHFPNGREAFEQEGKAAVAKFDAALASLGVRARRKPEGQGKVAMRCRELATEALEEALGVPVQVHTLWNQQGAFRGKYWDLDRWGVTFEFDGPAGRPMKGTASCLATMTDCARTGIHAEPDSMFGTFHLHPKITARARKAGNGGDAAAGEAR